MPKTEVLQRDLKLKAVEENLTPDKEAYHDYFKLPEPDDTQGHVAYNIPGITLEQVHAMAVWLVELDPASRAVVIARHFKEMYYGVIHGTNRSGDTERYTLHYAIQRIGWQ